MKEKHLVIQQFKDRYTIRAMCRFFEISESGYYAFAKRPHEKSDEERLCGWIEECQKAVHFTYGYRRVCLWLRANLGLCINHKKVLRIMHAYDLLAKAHRRRHYHQYGEYLLEHPNLLNRNFEAIRPNQKWVTDISFIKTRQGIMYLSVLKDLYDGFIVSYRTARRNDNALVLETLQQAYRQAERGLILHSDQGFQYASLAYQNLTREYGIRPSMSRKGTPLDNAPAESFFSTLKMECLYRQKTESFEQANMLIQKYIHFYNYERIQLKSKLTPFEKRCQLA